MNLKLTALIALLAAVPLYAEEDVVPESFSEDLDRELGKCSVSGCKRQCNKRLRWEKCKKKNEKKCYNKYVKYCGEKISKAKNCDSQSGCIDDKMKCRSECQKKPWN
mmetsp:Transcript_1741/g.4636  ORF Transcript_1741/g.4636 Transcript_1741/m.4636 type:complete len:107 (-) Transcript_1741:268-588(-)